MITIELAHARPGHSSWPIAFNFDNRLNGFPEYILARRSPLGKVVFDKPYLLLMEAKQDNFEAVWAQCLAEMIAAQRLNQEPPITVFSIASNGISWQFGKLEGNQFVRMANDTPAVLQRPRGIASRNRDRGHQGKCLP